MPIKKGGINIKNIKHGLSAHPVYWVWATLKNRCCNKNEPAYKDYGGRGVKICDEWFNNPKAFIDWAVSNGYKKGLQLDKDIKARQLGIEPLLYSPDTCMFVTPQQNANSRRSSRLIEYKGRTQTLMQWSRELGIKSTTLGMRLDTYRFTVEEAFNKPLQNNKKKV